MKNLLFLVSIVVLSFSCAQPGWVRKDNGVTVRLKPDNPESVGSVRFEFPDYNIVHVISSHDRSIPKEKNLYVTGKDELQSEFTVRQVIDTLMITTSGMQIKVSLVSGKIVFCNQDGRITDFSRKIEDKTGYYIINGRNYDELISGSRSLTGKAPIMPEWALGCWQCHEFSGSGKQKKGIAYELIRHELPRDSVVKHWAYNPDGSPGKTWEDLQRKIKDGINYSLSGIPYWTIDIDELSPEGRLTETGGGMENPEESGELYARWCQFGSFCPLFRDHGQLPSHDISKPHASIHPGFKSRLYYSKLRYCLIPYLYSLAGLTYFNDYTMMRAMVMDFGDDKNVNGITDQYMFGPSILVAPIYTFRTAMRKVYLPGSCGWYDFYSGKHLSGGRIIDAEAPYERIPLYVKDGSIIPVWTTEKYPSNRPSDPLTFYIYTGRDCAFTLYEDEEINYNYEKGACSTIKISYNDSNNQITIGERTGEFPGMLKSRRFNFVLVTGEDSAPFDPDAEPRLSVGYEGRQITFETGKIN